MKLKTSLTLREGERPREPRNSLEKCARGDARAPVSASFETVSAETPLRMELYSNYACFSLHRD